MKARINLQSLAGFVVAAAFAVVQKWSLPEFCWSTWLAGLVYAWACVLTGCLQILLTARTSKAEYDRRVPFLRHVSPGAFLLALSVLMPLIGWLAFRIYEFFFGFYGLFLSVFSEMEPLELFGRDGFINSDFYTPVVYLLVLFWPMTLGVVIANWRDLFRKDPWKRVLLPFQKEILRIHILVLALPFFALLAWALFREAYQSITIVLLMGLFYLLPKQAKENGPEPRANGDPPIDRVQDI